MHKGLHATLKVSETPLTFSMTLNALNLLEYFGPLALSNRRMNIAVRLSVRPSVTGFSLDLLIFTVFYMKLGLNKLKSSGAHFLKKSLLSLKWGKCGIFGSKINFLELFSESVLLIFLKMYLMIGIIKCFKATVLDFFAKMGLRVIFWFKISIFEAFSNLFSRFY